MLKLMLNRIMLVPTPETARETRRPKLFLDSDQLVDLDELLKDVVRSEVHFVLLTDLLFTRPWCITELVAAHVAGVPMKRLRVTGYSTKKLDALEAGGAGVYGVTEEDMCNLAGGQDVIDFVVDHNYTMDQIREAIGAALASESIEYDPTAAEEVQWGQLVEVQKRFFPDLQLAMGDPVREMCHRHRWLGKRLLGYFLHVGARSVAPLLRLMCEEVHRAVHPGSPQVILVDDDRSGYAVGEAALSDIANSDNVFVLLDNRVLSCPGVIVKLVAAHKAGINLVPVTVQSGFNFAKYTDLEFYYSLTDAFDDESKRMFANHGIRYAEIAGALQALFKKIALDFNALGSYTVQQAQVYEIMRRIHVSGGE